MKKAYFISDLHLGASYIEDEHARERLIVRFLDSIAGDAAELYLVGDILDYWFEYRTAVPRGYVRFFGALARLADSGVKITWLIGNHDIWLFDYLRNEIGMTVVDGILETEILGTQFLITHGDGVGHRTRGFRFIRALFRNKFCQKLYSGIHPRWTIPFAHRWSRHSRATEQSVNFDTASDSIIVYARHEAATNPEIRYFVFGHRHVVCDVPVSNTARAIILGDWLSNFSYGVFDGTDFQLLTLSRAFIKGDSNNLDQSVKITN